MKYLIKISFFLPFLFLFNSCDELVESNTASISGDWSIPKDEVFDGGPGKDGIPALTNPEFTTISGAGYLNDDDLIIGIKVRNDIRGYPHPILDWHEIINDDLGEKSFAITYCPLTGSGIAWDRNLNGRNTTFGVSGLLYNTNLIPYDRLTNSNWSQMLLQSVNGENKDKEINTFSIIETSVATWKRLYPNSLVVSTSTGFNRDYGRYPYGGYRTNSSLIFPVSRDDTRLARKTRVLGVIVNGATAAFQFDKFNGELVLKNEQLYGRQVVLLGSETNNILTAYFPVLDDGKEVVLSATPSTLPSAMEDQLGNIYDLFGTVVDGPDKGKHLTAPKSYIAYWFAWAAFYSNTSLN